MIFVWSTLNHDAEHIICQPHLCMPKNFNQDPMLLTIFQTQWQVILRVIMHETCNVDTHKQQMLRLRILQSDRWSVSLSFMDISYRSGRKREQNKFLEFWLLPCGQIYFFWFPIIVFNLARQLANANRLARLKVLKVINDKTRDHSFFNGNLI